jgi:hypothetical protein
MMYLRLIWPLFATALSGLSGLSQQYRASREESEPHWDLPMQARGWPDRSQIEVRPWRLKMGSIPRTALLEL